MPLKLNCYAPLTLRLSGRPSEEDWETLEATLVRHYTRAFRRSTELYASGYDTNVLIREEYDTARDTREGYLIPSYDDGEQTPVDVAAPGVEAGPALLTLGRIRELIAQHWTQGNGLPVNGVHRGIYTTEASMSHPELYYLDAEGRLKSLFYFTEDANGQNQQAIRLAPGNYTMILVKGQREGQISVAGWPSAPVTNNEDVDLTVVFNVPDSGNVVPPPAAPLYEFYPRAWIKRLYSDQPMTTRSFGYYAAQVQIWRQDEVGDWFPILPLAFIYLHLSYTWRIWKVPRKGPNILIYKVSGPREYFLEYEWKTEGDYEITLEVQLDYPNASPRPVLLRRKEHIERLSVAQGTMLANLEKLHEDPTKQPIWATSGEEAIRRVKDLLDKETDEGQKEALRDVLAGLQKQLIGTTSAGPYPIHAIFTDRKTSLTKPLSLFVGPAADNDDPDTHVWLLIDVTYPPFYAAYKGEGSTVDEAIRAAFETSRTSFHSKYPPGQILARVRWSGMEAWGIKEFEFPIETDSWQRDAWQWLTIGVQVVGMAALAAAFVFPPSGIITGALLVTMGAGAVISAVNIASRVNANAFEWDAETACDIVNIAVSIALAGGAVAGGLSRAILAAEQVSLTTAAGKLTAAGATVAKLQNFQRAAMMVGLTGDVSQGIILTWSTYEELRATDAAIDQSLLKDYQRIYGEEQGLKRWQAEREARIIGVLARAALTGFLIVVSARSGYEGIQTSRRNSITGLLETVTVTPDGKVIVDPNVVVDPNAPVTTDTPTPVDTTTPVDPNAPALVHPDPNVQFGPVAPPPEVLARNQRLADVETAVRAEDGWIKQHGAALEASAMTAQRQAGETPLNLNNLPPFVNAKNTPLLDISSTSGLQSVKAKAVDSPYTKSTVSSYKRDFHKLLDDKKAGAAAAVLDNWRGFLQQRGAWPNALPPNASRQDIVDFIKTRAELAVPDDHVADVRAAITREANDFPQNFDLNPNSPTLQQDIAALTQRVQGGGTTTSDIRDIQVVVRAQQAAAQLAIQQAAAAAAAQQVPTVPPASGGQNGQGGTQ